MLLGNKLKRCVWGCMTSAAVLMTSQSVSAELIFQESFEGPLQTETNIVGGFANGQAQNFWAVLPARGLRGAPFWNQAASGGLDGRRYFAGRDIHGNGNATRAVDFLNINIAGYTNIQLTVSLASRRGRSSGDSGVNNQNTNFERNDRLRVRRSLDGAGFSNLEVFAGLGGLNVGLISLTDGTELTSALTDFSYNIADGSTVDFRIDGRRLQANNEAIAFDNIRVTGDRIQVSVPEPGTLALFGLGLVGLGFARRRKAA